MSRIVSLLELGSPVRALADSRHLPCCTLTAAVSLALAGRVPSNPLSISAWSRMEPQADWWERANIDLEQWQSRKWSPLLASMDLLGGDLHIGPAPKLLEGRAHLVQDWRRDLSSGHSYLILPTASGWLLADSSTRRGLRMGPLTSWPRLSGRLCGVLAFPVGL